MMIGSGAGEGLPDFSGLGRRDATFIESVGKSAGEPVPLPPLSFCIAARPLRRPDSPRHFSRCAAKRVDATLSLSQEVHLKYCMPESFFPFAAAAGRSPGGVSADLVLFFDFLVLEEELGKGMP